MDVHVEMDEELFQRVCTDVGKLLELHYPNDLKQRAAAAGMVHAVMLYAICNMYRQSDAEQVWRATSYLKDLMKLFKAHPELVKVRLVEVP